MEAYDEVNGGSGYHERFRRARSSSYGREIDNFETPKDDTEKVGVLETEEQPGSKARNGVLEIEEQPGSEAIGVGDDKEDEGILGIMEMASETAGTKLKMVFASIISIMFVTTVCTS
eukprot:CAMPEP_0113322216 /NCGR_PEP_ID=MMETSP0010_2-20120614/15458_1 /TAXON_ID=216773 ORGANISM="Corethron hystrix, Strain 308" /NCGR_SAMPLE_ID=MMETSP0010_2 /ASSEMBLY_ACC=CAM_ASM_000155 /LENGTH=116 /DNA_ID=CAMNT_0000180643 /DNA_START=3 /DNA_END=353 /DNA_ORIENTATION=- /assembly_acc=CAM_ASM_000155